MAAPKQTEFRPLTREALEEMSQGLAERRRASGRNGSDRAASGTEEDDAPPPSSPDPLWSEGETVSRYLVQFPERLAGTPLEEVDPFYYGHGSGALTFVVVSMVGGAGDRTMSCEPEYGCKNYDNPTNIASVNLVMGCCKVFSGRTACTWMGWW